MRVGEIREDDRAGHGEARAALLKRVIDYRKRRLGLLVNPVNTEDVKRPAVRDERDVRLSDEERTRLLAACDQARNIWLRLSSSWDLRQELGAAAS